MDTEEKLKEIEKQLSQNSWNEGYGLSEEDIEWIIGAIRYYKQKYQEAITR